MLRHRGLNLLKKILVILMTMVMATFIFPGNISANSGLPAGASKFVYEVGNSNSTSEGPKVEIINSLQNTQKIFNSSDIPQTGLNIKDYEISYLFLFSLLCLFIMLCIYRRFQSKESHN